MGNKNSLFAAIFGMFGQPSFVDSKGQLQNFDMTKESIMNDLAQEFQLTPRDAYFITQKFEQWAGYLPHISPNKERDFHNFVNYCIKNNEERIIAALVLIIYMHDPEEN